MIIHNTCYSCAELAKAGIEPGTLWLIGQYNRKNPLGDKNGWLLNCSLQGRRELARASEYFIAPGLSSFPKHLRLFFIKILRPRTSSPAHGPRSKFWSPLLFISWNANHKQQHTRGIARFNVNWKRPHSIDITNGCKRPNFYNKLITLNNKVDNLMAFHLFQHGRTLGNSLPST